jgi:adenine-specific DNA-methyltransferase
VGEGCESRTRDPTEAGEGFSAQIIFAKFVANRFGDNSDNPQTRTRGILIRAMKHEFARELRRNQTDVERKLWYIVRDRRLAKFKFRRQQPIGDYIVDFVCFQRKLVVELDGSQHAEPERVAYDERRTRFLETQGFRVMRFWNHEINEDADVVAETIGRALEEPLTRG